MAYLSDYVFANVFVNNVDCRRFGNTFMKQHLFLIVVTIAAIIDPLRSRGPNRSSLKFVLKLECLAVAIMQIILNS